MSFTFGYEAEFENNVEPVLADLQSRGLAGDGVLHGYHCRCDNCCFTSGWAYRGQTDSSCGGEIISTVCEDHDTGREWMDALQAAAVDADAEPSMRAGFHVHVGTRAMEQALGYNGRHRAVWNYLRWESLLGDLAQGRFGTVRTFNQPLAASLVVYSEAMEDMLVGYGVTDPLPWKTTDRWGGPMFTGSVDVAWLEERMKDDHRMAEWLRCWTHDTLLEDIDRHGWLNAQTRNYKTLEFRLWNSTRSAWRMETFVRTSLLFVNPEAEADLASKPVKMRSFLALAERHDPGLKALLKRQLDCPKTDGPLTVMASATAAAVSSTPGYSTYRVDDVGLPVDDFALGA